MVSLLRCVIGINLFLSRNFLETSVCLWNTVVICALRYFTSYDLLHITVLIVELSSLS
jgi:hypothetical protein